MIIRILSFNIHKGVGWGIRKSTLDQMHANLCELQPDIIFLQEIRGSQFDMISTGIWPHFSYGKNAVYTKGHHGNAILSKFPIISSENIDLSMHRYEHRGLLHSTIKINRHNETVHLFCVHLGLFKNDRRKQIHKIIKYIQTNLPGDEPLILSGDFNDWNNYATEPLVNDLGLGEAFLNSHGSFARTYPAWAPVFRLDRIYFRGFHVHHAHRLIKMPWKYLSDHIALEAHLTYKL